NDEIDEALTTLWGSAAPSTWNRNRATVASCLSWCRTTARWLSPAVPTDCERRREADDVTRAVTVPVIERICTRRDVPSVSGCSDGCCTRPPPAPVPYSPSTSKTATSKPAARP